jgi:type VI secretion system protein ImpG
MQEHNPNFSRLLPFYQREMAYLLKVGQEFAKAYPRAAEKLELSAKGSSDPHVERLLESFAFLTGRLQMEVEDHQSLISNYLLDVLYPQFSKPYPSCVITKLEPKDEASELFKGRVVPARTPLSTVSEEGITCKFQTTMDSEVWPLDVVDVSYERSQFYDLSHYRLKSPWLLRLRIKAHEGSLASLPVEHLVFHLGGDILTAFTLFRWLNTYDPQEPIPVFWVNEDRKIIDIPNAYSPLGFRANEDIIPEAHHTSSAQRQLWDFFHFPQKFLFFKIANLRPVFDAATGDTLDLLLPLPGGSAPEQWPLIKQNVALGCVPAVNVFAKTSEPIKLDHRKTFYRLITDYRFEEFMEVHSIQKISSATTIDTPAETVHPYFSYTHDIQENKDETFWVGHRIQTSLPNTRGTDMLLSFIDYRLKTLEGNEQTVYAHMLCTNRNFAEKIPVHAKFDVQGDFAGLHAVALFKPTRVAKPILFGDTQWQLINHLALDHLGLCANMNSTAPLKKMLKLYNKGHASLGFAIEALQDIHFEKTVSVLGEKFWKTFVPMLSITLKVDDQKANTQGFFVLCMILKDLFKTSSGFNTLIQTRIVGLSDNTIKLWEPEPCNTEVL